MDGYNWGTTRFWSEWQSFRQIFGRAYSDYSTRRKPIMICEVAAAEPAAPWPHGSRTRGLQTTRTLLPRGGARVVEADVENDWRIESSSSALAAFRSVLRADR